MAILRRLRGAAVGRSRPGRGLADFDLETLEYFYTAAHEILRLVERTSRA